MNEVDTNGNSINDTDNAPDNCYNSSSSCGGDSDTDDDTLEIKITGNPLLY